jgi:hypothetical protein
MPTIDKPSLHASRPKGSIETINPAGKGLFSLTNSAVSFFPAPDSGSRLLSLKEHKLARGFGGVGMTMKTSPLRNLLLDIRTVKILSMERGSNWDGEGADAITRTVCEAAIFLKQLIDARALRAPDWIAPSTDGAIGFTWRTKSDQLNIQVSSLEKSGCVVRRSGCAGRSEKRCSVYAATTELSSFLGSDRGK